MPLRNLLYLSNMELTMFLIDTSTAQALAGHDHEYGL